MADRPLTLAHSRSVTADRLVEQAVWNAHAVELMQRIELIYPQIRAPLEGMAEALMAIHKPDEAKKVLVEGLQSLQAHWEDDVATWGREELRAMGLLRQVLTRLYEPAVASLGNTAPGTLRFQVVPCAERLEGLRVWADLRARELGVSDVDEE